MNRTIAVAVLIAAVADAGPLIGRRRAREAKEEATRQEMDNFKNALSVCMEAKNYMVKY